jgi:hypothetical protein
MMSVCTAVIVHVLVIVAYLRDASNWVYNTETTLFYRWIAIWYFLEHTSLISCGLRRNKNGTWILLFRLFGNAYIVWFCVHTNCIATNLKCNIGASAFWTKNNISRIIRDGLLTEPFQFTARETLKLHLWRNICTRFQVNETGSALSECTEWRIVRRAVGAVSYCWLIIGHEARDEDAVPIAFVMVTNVVCSFNLFYLRRVIFDVLMWLCKVLQLYGSFVVSYAMRNRQLYSVHICKFIVCRICSVMLICYRLKIGLKVGWSICVCFSRANQIKL